MRSRGLLESSSRASPIQRGDGDAILKSRRREEDGNKSAKESSVTFRMLVVLAGVACGFGFSSYSRIGANVQTLHRNVKGAYRAHNEAKKEYLKRYRESYLESLFASERIQEGEEIVEKGGNTPVAEVLATMTEVTKERVEEENEVDAGVSVTPASGTGLLPPSLSPSPPLPSPPPPPPPPPSPSPPPPPSPIQRKNTHVYIFNHLSDFGLGHLMQEFAKIYEICDMLNVGSVSIRECGTPNKPWHYSKMQSCKDTSSFGQNKNVFMYGKRSSDIDLSLGPNEETEDRDSFVHINGQVVNWIEVLENMTNPVTPTSVFVTEPHNMYIMSGKYSKVANNDACAGITKWFGDPSDFLLDELEKQRKRQSRGKGSKTHQNDIAFHFRLLDSEDLGIEVQPDLSIKLSEREIKVVDVRLDKEDGYGRLAHLDLKRAVDDVIDLAKKIFETSGLTTFVATDAPAIQAYLKDNPVISMIEHGGGAGDEKGEGWVTDDRDGNDSHYSLTSALEFYELGTAKKIVSFPFTSGFSRAASCLIEGGQYLGITTLDDLKKVIQNVSSSLA